MSDPTSPRDDELVSAVLDGEATEEELARVSADPTLRRRLAELEGLAARVGDVPAPDAARRAAAIDRAVDAGVGEASSDVVRLDDARRRRGRTLAVSAAAAVVVVLVGLGVLLRDTGDDVDVASEAADTEATSLAPADGDPGPGLYQPDATADDQLATREFADAAEQDAEAGLAPPEADVPDLGSFENRAELSRAVTMAIDGYLGSDAAAELAPSPAVATMTTAQADCAGLIPFEDPELVDVRFVATAGLAGEPLTVLLYGTDPDAAVNGSYRLYVLASATCLPIAGGVQTLD